MKGLISFFIRNEVLVNLFILLIIIFGVIGAASLNSSFFPEQDTKIVKVEAVYPGASPLEVEEGITLKVEENLKGISGIDRITSVSSENTTTINVEMLPKADPNEVLREVKNAVDRIASFPPGLERIVVYKQEMVNFTAEIALSGSVPLQALKEKAEQVEDDLREFEDISKIIVSGYTEPEIEIAVNENILRTYELTFEDIAMAINRENINITGGKIRNQRQEIIIRADNKQYFADRLGDIIVKANPDGSVVRLREVAELHDTFSESTNRMFFNDEQVVSITVNTTNEEDILDAAGSIRNYIQNFNQSNEVITATLIEDATTTLRERISILEKNGLIGASLVFLMLGVFLRLRLAFWVALGIPISFLGMFILAQFYGLTINVLSLFGMILVVGILVDDGVVVGENIFQEHEKGKNRFDAAVKGTMDVLPSIVAAIATTSIAFAFFFFIEGQLGEFFSDVSFVVIASLLISLIEVIFFLPSHLAHSKDLQSDYKPNKIKEWLSNLMFRFRDSFYQPILKFVIANPLFYALVVLSAIVITFAAISGGWIRTAFFPNIEQNTVNVTLEMPAGTADSVTENVIRRVSAVGDQLNQQYQEEYGEENVIEDIELEIGPGSNKAVAKVYLKPAEARSIRSFNITSDLRQAVGPVPIANKLSFETQTPFGKPVSISLSSDDYQELRDAKEILKDSLNQLGTLKDIIDTDREDQPELEISLKPKARLLGLDLAQVIRQVRYGFFGYEVQRLQRGDNEVKVWVRYDITDRDEIENLKQMRIRTPEGQEIPLDEIADINSRKGLIAINHRDGEREIKVEADLASLDVSAPEQIEIIRSNILPGILSQFPGVDAIFEGQVRETRKLQQSVQSVGPIILILIIGMLVLTFRSFSQAWALLVLIPFGIIGAVWGHFIHDLPLSVLSIMGFVALIGILFNDGLVFINTFNQMLKKGVEYQKALFDTAMSRFRPLLLTTITTAAGLGPLIFETSFQAQFLIPMAVTIAYGLLVGSFLISTLLPILLITFNRLKVYSRWLWEGQKPPPESVERAVKEKQKEEEYAQI